MASLSWDRSSQHPHPPSPANPVILNKKEEKSDVHDNGASLLSMTMNQIV